MNKTIISIVIAIIVVGGIVWLGRPVPQDSNAGALIKPSLGALIAEETNFNFETISMAAGNVTHSFKVKNTGAESVVIEKMYTSCMCTTALLIKDGEKFGPYGMPGHGFIPKMNATLNPNEEAIVEVVFNPAAHGPAGVGRIQREVILENSGGQPLELGFTATVAP